MAKQLFAFCSLIALLLAPTCVQAKPPTLDPTYGLPLPAHASLSPPRPVLSGNWIWAPRVADGQTVLFRRTFRLAGAPDAAIVHITADNRFTLYANGRVVAPLAGQTLPRDWSQVEVYDLAPFLSAGVNVIAVDAQNDAGSAGLLLHLHLPGRRPIVSDDSWKIHDGALPQPAQWTRRAFDDSGWPAAIIEAPADGEPWASTQPLQGWPGLREAQSYLAHIALPVARVVAVLSGGGAVYGEQALAGSRSAVITAIPAAPGAEAPSMVVDFGREVAGRLALSGLSGGTVDVGTGESLGEATNWPWHGIAAVPLVPSQVVYTPYSAFRYAKLTFPAGEHAGPVRFRVWLDDKYYPVRYEGSFSCSDSEITRIWYTGAYTAHLCMQEDIWDAPKRDRKCWAGDLAVSGAVIDDVFADRFLMQQTLQRLRQDAGRGDINQIPGYTCAWICTLAGLYRHTGDLRFLKQQHGALISLLSLMRSEVGADMVFDNSRGEWTFVDWSPDFSADTPQAYATTDLFYCKAAREGAVLLRSMGDTAGAAHYAHWAGQLKQAARRSLAGARPTYGERLQENAMAVYSGVATAAQRSAIYRTVLSLGSPAWRYHGPGSDVAGVITPYYGYYILRALSASGHTRAGIALLRSYWGGMLSEGATTFWEAYDPSWPKLHFHRHLRADNNEGTFVSLCHGWSSGPTAWLTDQVLGVRPTSGGFDTVDIAPHLGGLAWAEGVVPTPHGPIHIRLDAKPSRGIACRLTLPKGIAATIVLPGKLPIHVARAGTIACS